MWYEIIIATLAGICIGAAIFAWGFNTGYNWAKDEDEEAIQFDRYVEAMKQDDENV